MRVLCILCFSLILSACASSQNNMDVNKRFLHHLEAVERFVNIEDDKTDGEALYQSIIFLEDLTGIHSSVTQNFDPVKFPTKENYENWKEWFEENKHLLYWDDSEQKVKLRKE